MQRRKFILLSAVGSTAISLTGISCGQRHPAYYRNLDKPGQLSQLCDTKTIGEIGKEYRLQVPAESKADQLETLLSNDPSGKPVSSSADSLFVQNLINQKILRDFEKGNTVVVNGWILAVTEARQCALFYVNNN
jgi:hypothetical protein